MALLKSVVHPKFWFLATSPNFDNSLGPWPTSGGGGGGLPMWWCLPMGRVTPVAWRKHACWGVPLERESGGDGGWREDLDLGLSARAPFCLTASGGATVTHRDRGSSAPGNRTRDPSFGRCVRHRLSPGAFPGSRGAAVGRLPSLAARVPGVQRDKIVVFCGRHPEAGRHGGGPPRARVVPNKVQGTTAVRQYGRPPPRPPCQASARVPHAARVPSVLLRCGTATPGASVAQAAAEHPLSRLQRRWGATKFFSGAFGANWFRPSIFFSACVPAKNSAPPDGGGGGAWDVHCAGQAPLEGGGVACFPWHEPLTLTPRAQCMLRGSSSRRHGSTAPRACHCATGPWYVDSRFFCDSWRGGGSPIAVALTGHCYSFGVDINMHHQSRARAGSMDGLT